MVVWIFTNVFLGRCLCKCGLITFLFCKDSRGCFTIADEYSVHELFVVEPLPCWKKGMHVQDKGKVCRLLQLGSRRVSKCSSLIARNRNCLFRLLSFVFRPSAMKSGRPYEVMYVSSWCKTPPPHSRLTTPPQAELPSTVTPWPGITFSRDGWGALGLYAESAYTCWWLRYRNQRSIVGLRCFSLLESGKDVTLPSLLLHTPPLPPSHLPPPPENFHSLAARPRRWPSFVHVICVLLENVCWLQMCFAATKIVNSCPTLAEKRRIVTRNHLHFFNKWSSCSENWIGHFLFTEQWGIQKHVFRPRDL